MCDPRLEAGTCMNTLGNLYEKRLQCALVHTLRLIGIDAVVLDTDRRMLPECLLEKSSIFFSPLFIWRGRQLELSEMHAQRQFAADVSLLTRQREIGRKRLIALNDHALMMLISDEINEAPVVVVAILERRIDARVCAHCLQEAFGLTEREARVAASIGSGRSMQEVAAELQISVSTVRTHLQNVFLKTGVNTQQKLVALVAGSAFGRCETS